MAIYETRGFEHRPARFVRTQADRRYSPDEIFGIQCAKTTIFRRFVLSWLNSVVILHTVTCRLMFQGEWWLVYKELAERRRRSVSAVDGKSIGCRHPRVTSIGSLPNHLHTDNIIILREDLMKDRLGKLEIAKLYDTSHGKETAVVSTTSVSPLKMIPNPLI